MPVPAPPLLFALLALACSGAVAAAPPTPGSELHATVFEPGQLSDSATASAYDLLQRVPGFSLVEADADVRGYAGAQGNVLIDGVRPTSKSESVADQLKRLPARAIERIELLRTAAAGVDMAGFALFANIVRRQQAEHSTRIEGGALIASDGWTAPILAIDHARQDGSGSLELSLGLKPEVDEDAGEGSIRSHDAAGNELAGSRFDSRVTGELRELGADWQRRLAAGKLNANLSWREETLLDDTQVRSEDSGEAEESVQERERLREAEFGLRYGQALGPRSRLEFVLSQQLGWLEADESSVAGTESERFEQDSDSGERIGRIEWTHEPNAQWHFAVSAEGALNTLDGTASLQRNDAPVPLPGSAVRIEERRSEFAAGATWTASAAWSVDVGLRAEQSAIAQTGDTPLRRSFQYWKPRLALDWQASAADRLRLSLSREVGQLDFADFLASASLDSDSVSAGNAQLEPDKTWRLGATWERRLWQGAALTLGLTHERISDVVDRVLVVTDEAAFDAPGNIGDGRRDSLELELTAPLDRFGLAGGLLRASALWRHSEVTDPVTGAQRPISEEAPFEGSIGFKRESPARGLNWGVDLEFGKHETSYRFDEIVRESEGAGWSAFIERHFGHWRLRAELTEPFGRHFDESREQYPGPRSSSTPEETEGRAWRMPASFGLTLRHSSGD